MATSGATTGGTNTYKATPSPTSITVQHASGAGTKSVTIAASTRISVYMWSGSTSQTGVTGDGSVSVTSTTLYTFRKNVSAGVATATITNTSNGYVKLEDGDLIHAGSTLQMWRAAAEGYTLTAAHFGGGGIVENGATYKISGNTTVTITAQVNSYSLSISTDGNSTVTVNRTSSPLKGAATGALSSGATIYYNDVLEITVTADTGYEIKTATLNGGTVTSPYTVTGAVSIVTTASALGFVYIDTGTELKAYLIYIDTGSAWKRYRAYVDTGTGFKSY